MARICRDVEERVEETRVETVERIERFSRQVQETLCDWMPWPADALCKTIVKVIEWVVKTVFTIVSTVVRIYLRVVCEVVAFATNIVGAVINTILSIPIIGPIIKAVVRTVVEIWSQYVGMVDAVARLFGIRIPKYLRICIVILREEDGRPVAQPSDLDAALTWAKDAFYRGARVHLRVQGIYTAGQGAPRDNLDVNTEAGAVWDELWLPGGYFQASANYHCFENAFNLAIGLAGPVVVFVTRSVRGQATGCSLLTFTDYVTVERGTFVGPTADPTVLAHELGHACMLVHTPNQTTLMFPNSSGTPASSRRGAYITPYQTTLLRNSRHVTFF